MERVYELKNAADTMEVIRTVDFLYNEIVDPQFEKQHGSLERVLAVTLEELTEFSWKDYLEEEALEETFSAYLDKVTESMTNLDMMEQEKQQEKEEDGEEENTNRKKVLVVDEKALERMYSYVQRNYGKTFLTVAEEKRLNYLLCRGIHADCSLYFTEGVLKNPVLRNYQYEYAEKAEG